MATNQRNGSPVEERLVGKSQPATVGAPSISLPKGGGAIRGIGEKFAANPVTGTGSMTVPLATSPGRSGFGPQLSLSYDSGGGNGPFGLGWNLPLPSITRKTDKGLPRYFDAEESDVYILSGSEDLVPVLDLQNGAWKRHREERTLDGDAYAVHLYRPRIEGLFARIERWTRLRDGDTHWRSTSKENVTTLYGATANARIADPSDSTRVFSWLICQSYDDKGNAVVYDYVAEDSASVDLSKACERNRSDASRSANRYVKRIRYGNKPSRLMQSDLSQLTWLFEIVFDYGEGHYETLPTDTQGRQFVTASVTGSNPWGLRQDPFSSYRPGFEVRTYRLCRRVLMFHHFPGELGVEDYLVRSTELDYRESSIASFIVSVTQSGFQRQNNGTYLKKSLPSLDLEYSEATVQEEVHEVDPENLANIPAGIEGGRYQWVDLDGEGMPCVLAEDDEGWYYKRNLSPLTFTFDGGTPKASVRFEPVTELATLPSFANMTSAHHQFLDLAGDGQLDCLVLEQPTAGFFKRTEEESWESFRPLPSLPNIDWSELNLRFIDLDGDGHADILITENEVMTWYSSLAEGGFGPATQVPKTRDEEEGPAIVFADSTQAIYLADMSGDGLTDIVRIRNGEVCYWPNLGYGRFGRKVNMDRAPWFDVQDQFDQKRLRLADIDGSGVADVIYLGSDGVRLYFNQSGNAWSQPHALSAFPQVDNLSSVQALDLLGNGTACLVWTSSLPGDSRHSMRYIDLMGGEKPHLLIGSRNNLGVETRVFYAPSTMFYLADRAAEQPWITRLPFPVHVVERVETYDWVSRNRFVTRYSYHHGFFDGVEREFHGFGRVEQRDTEELGVLSESGIFPDASNVDAASYVPTVLTNTWFHTGAFLEGERISRHFEEEYYRESDLNQGVQGLTDAQFEAMLLPDTVLPAGLDGDEFREACLSLKGAILRQEVYALDNADQADRPYAVSERNYTVQRLQPVGPNRHGVFFTHARETIDFHYERKLYNISGKELADPRVTHNMVLAVDDFGNTLKSVAVGYGRRHDSTDPLLGSDDRARQKRTLITYTESAYTNPISADHAYRAPLPAETRTYELINIVPDRNAQDITNLFGLDEMLDKTAKASDGQHDLPYEDGNAAGAVANHPYRRLIEHLRMLYRKNDLSGALALGVLESLALPFESNKLALTPGLIGVYKRGQANLLPNVPNVLRDDAGYVLGDDMKSQGLFPQSEPVGHWWIPSGRSFFSVRVTDPAPQELATAQAHFFLPRRFHDPFGNDSTVLYDAHDLLLLETEDALHNKVTAGERATNGKISGRNDYRVLQPALITDANGNRTEVAFDTLGLVAGTALMGKSNEKLGDSLTGFVADLTQEQLDQFFTDPKGALPQTLLGNATTRIVYDLGRFARNGKTASPIYAATIARETHVSDLGQNQDSALQVSFSYSDGFSREIQRKIPAEPGQVAANGPTVDPRWVGSGWTVFNNKGKPVRQYEPFFDDTHDFRFGQKVGVSPILFYDPIGRVVATLRPNHSFEKVIFDPWRQETWDTNDTVLVTDPKSDPDVGDFFRRIPDSDYLPTWYKQRIGGALGQQEQQAAQKASAHAATPTIAFADTLGRTFLTVADNGVAGKYATRVELDIEGNQRSVTDALGRKVMTYDYDMLGTRIHQNSVDAGERWMLNDVLGKPLRAWDSRDHQMRHEYDALRRPAKLFVRTGQTTEKLAERIVYGEGVPNDQALNLRGKIFQQFDAAGVVTSNQYDFKGNLLSSTRQLLQNYKDEVDWGQSPALESEKFASSTTYDALNRPATMTTPDSSLIRPAYNEANLLEQVHVNLRGSVTATAFVTNIDYDAKGRRKLIEYGNGASTTYQYDPATLRLVHLKTIRKNDQAVLQDLRYTYDPGGNITAIRDAAQQTIYFKNQVVSANNDYVYDAIYRLIGADGREHMGQLAQPQTNWDDEFHVNLPHPGDGQAMRNYHEDYEYDPAGNILKIIHTAAGGNWTRSYAYDEPNLNPTNNRLTSTSVGALKEPYKYDAHGNITRMPHLPGMEWGFKDQLHATERQVVNNTPGEKTYYVYDAGGQRVRKVTETGSGVKKQERVYLGGFELYREYNGNTITLERETLHVMDDKQRVALVETRTQGNDGSPAQLMRFQFGNHLGSACLELDDQANVISYEEYFPYGATSYQAVDKTIKAAAKRYRYTGKERDEQTGLYYHGARYYAPWLGRWTAVDPKGFVDGTNVFAFVRNNPISRIDPTGTQGIENVDILSGKRALHVRTSEGVALYGGAVDVGATTPAKAAPPLGSDVVQRSREYVEQPATAYLTGKKVVAKPPSVEKPKEETVADYVPGVGGVIGKESNVEAQKGLAAIQPHLQTIQSVTGFGGFGGALGAALASAVSDDPRKVAGAAATGNLVWQIVASHFLFKREPPTPLGFKPLTPLAEALARGFEPSDKGAIFHFNAAWGKINPADFGKANYGEVVREYAQARGLGITIDDTPGGRFALDTKLEGRENWRALSSAYAIEAGLAGRPVNITLGGVASEDSIWVRNERPALEFFDVPIKYHLRVIQNQ